ncbi:hypothetical protein [Burkholderia latens]|uniref:hypothetical protein n=1 Tax=Burkholderia latens TaxID=488446 RepID=UPI001AEA07C6|nr:hypothetical protein [Burkholderia latens]QTO46363.1 hypothetical protein J8I85_18125 [Burkholderia latens]
MTTLANMSQRELLAQINIASNAKRRYELADGNRWHDEKHMREACGAELDALAAEWRRRNLR